MSLDHAEILITLFFHHATALYSLRDVEMNSIPTSEIVNGQFLGLFTRASRGNFWAMSMMKVNETQAHPTESPNSIENY